jgi:hypothetical protein
LTKEKIEKEKEKEESLLNENRKAFKEDREEKRKQRWKN